MRRFFISLALVLGVVTGTTYGAVVRPGTGFSRTFNTTNPVKSPVISMINS